MLTAFFCVYCNKNIIIDAKTATEAQDKYQAHVKQCKKSNPKDKGG